MQRFLEIDLDERLPPILVKRIGVKMVSANVGFMARMIVFPPHGPSCSKIHVGEHVVRRREILFEVQPDLKVRLVIEVDPLPRNCEAHDFPKLAVNRLNNEGLFRVAARRINQLL